MKIILNIILIAFATIAIILSGCKKPDSASTTPKDTTPPVITLLGADTLYVSLNSLLYTEPGFTATDNVDGNITNKVTWSTAAVNKDLTGSYPIVYTVY